MLDQITILDVIVVTVLGSAFGLISAQVANDSSKETHHGKPLASWVWVSYILINAIFGAIFQWVNPWFYAALLLVVAFFQAVNLEGRKRRISWHILTAFYAFLLILSVVYRRTENKFSPLWLFWLIPIILPFICSVFSAHRIQKLVDKKNEKERGALRKKTLGVDTIGLAISWGAIVILFLSIVVLALI